MTAIDGYEMELNATPRACLDTNIINALSHTLSKTTETIEEWKNDAIHNA